MIKRVARTLQSSGSTLHRHSFELAGASLAELRQIVHVKINVVRDEEIQLPIAIVIHERGAG